ncbi:MAG TPA: hypothetical protein VG166_04360 [Caulobacteraceae bacterium]|jgi:hypothetical protein|nr:hypothetical protein [Caulobacteraceae bacterium]
MALKTWALTLALTGSALAARADPRLDEVVYSPYIENRVVELETRLGQEIGAGDEQNARTVVIEAEAGVSDRLSVALVGSVERESGGSRLTGLGLESRYYVGQVPVIGVDVGLYAEVTKGLAGENGGGEAKLLLARTEGRFQGLVNLIVERPFGAPTGEEFASYGYAASATWRTVGSLRIGAEAFGDLGDDHGLGAQGAYVGPQIKWEGRPGRSPFEIGVDAGWLAAVGPARREASSQARINLEIERRF